MVTQKCEHTNATEHLKMLKMVSSMYILPPKEAKKKECGSSLVFWDGPHSVQSVCFSQGRPLLPFETDCILSVGCISLNTSTLLLITLSLTEFFLQWDIKNLSSNKSWHQELRPPPSWRMELCGPSWLQSTTAWTRSTSVPIPCWSLICSSPLMNMHIALVLNLPKFTVQRLLWEKIPCVLLSCCR